MHPVLVADDVPTACDSHAQITERAAVRTSKEPAGFTGPRLFRLSNILFPSRSATLPEYSSAAQAMQARDSMPIWCRAFPRIG